jgi:hypothetical protein
MGVSEFACQAGVLGAHSHIEWNPSCVLLVIEIGSVEFSGIHNTVYPVYCSAITRGGSLVVTIATTITKWRVHGRRNSRDWAFVSGVNEMNESHSYGNTKKRKRKKVSNEMIEIEYAPPIVTKPIWFFVHWNQ